MIPWFGGYDVGVFCVMAFREPGFRQKEFGVGSISEGDTAWRKDSYVQMTGMSNALSPMLYGAVIFIQCSYKCIGASDNIFDHFIFLSSVPTTPSSTSQPKSI
jgi:hypothetical protein